MKEIVTILGKKTIRLRQDPDIGLLLEKSETGGRHWVSMVVDDDILDMIKATTKEYLRERERELWEKMIVDGMNK